MAADTDDLSVEELRALLRAALVTTHGVVDELSDVVEKLSYHTKRTIEEERGTDG